MSQLRPAKRKSPPKQLITSPQLRSLLDISKRETRLLGDVQRYLLTRGEDSERSVNVLHPSEIAHSDWCPRASYYRLAGVTPNKEAALPHWQMQMIWDEGKEIHKKWQHRFWDIGRLRGVFYCYNCRHSWWDLAPDECEQCHAGRVFLKYDEVPLSNPALKMAGQGDGLDGDDALIEIKSIGLGTLLFEAPDLLRAHTYQLNINGKQREFLDYDALWDSIRVPFPSHIRQAHLYSFLGAPVDEIFIYECKWNQKTKEMVVKYREDRIADRLEDCRRIVRALEGGPLPRCPVDGCPDCRRFEESADDATDQSRRTLANRPAAAEASASTHSRRLQDRVRPDGGPGSPSRLRRDWGRGA